MIKLKSVKVENFKSLEKTSIEEFGDTNMFYGFNNSGKSNIFKFLKLLFQTKTKTEHIEYYRDDSSESEESLKNIRGFWNGEIYDEPFLFIKNDRKKTITFEVDLNVSLDLLENNIDIDENNLSPGVNYVEFKFKGQIISKDINVSILELLYASINNKIFYKYDDRVDYFYELDENIKLDNKNGEAILSMFNDCVLLIDTDRNFVKEIIQDSVSTLNAKSFKKWLFELNLDSEKNEQFVNLVKFLKKFDFSSETKQKLQNNIESFPFSDATKIGFTKLGEEIEVMLENKSGRFPVKSFGTGIQQFFYLLTKIFINKSQIIIIEELELNLAPLYQKELLKFLKELMPNECSQILFSSHSPFFTLKDSNMVDYVHHVQINNSAIYSGTTVESYNELEYDDSTNESLFTLLYS